ncbi:MAG: glycosyltransferase family 2 protein [Gammaproteobacteria bacterium]|nr:glycosyltransferase family 2 protein [Gammaproteobacteria bacterium]
MMSQNLPLVSIVTPVYNGEAYLAQCIESVLGQTYQNWEYIIVNNCSTDGTLAIAEQYAQREPRIKIHNTRQLLSAVENHNFAVGKMDPASVYCKILHADDWLFPECLERMVDVAASNGSVGIVGSYNLVGNTVRCDGLPYPGAVIPGREAGRLALLGKAYPFYSPSSTMIRADLVRARAHFYDPAKMHADVELMYELLRDQDFGFVHQVLTYIRVHEASETARSAQPLNRILWSNFDLLVRFGPVFLNEAELQSAIRAYENKYYSFLARSLWELRDRKFWRYHEDGLPSLGHPLSYARLLGHALGEAVSQPRRTIARLARGMGLAGARK